MIKNKYTIFGSDDFLLCPLSVFDFVNVSVMDFFYQNEALTAAQFGASLSG